MREKITLGAALIGAITASLCCLGPIVAVVAGLGSFGAAAAFEAWRPYLLVVTFALLAAAFYLTYRRKDVACADGTCATRKASRWQKGVLWTATVVIVLFAAFPYYSGRFWAGLNGPSKEQSVASAAVERLMSVRLEVGGMTCGGCAAALASALEALPGVRSATASYEKGEATVEYDPERVRLEKLVEAVKEAGFTVKAVTATIPVEGMTCAGCAASVHQALVRRDGVKAVEVSVEKKHAVVTFDPARLTLEQVVEAINRTGFKAVL
ncbi:Copper-exporting P-type ATPase A [bacterium HR10]|nr:Copper-exporting P-type ATPase A [bacterium HR10]